MKTIVIGSESWESYTDLMRYMTILIQDAVEAHPDDRSMTFVHSGGRGAENMVTEYIGKTEKFLRQKKFFIKEKIIRKDKNFSLNDYYMMEQGADAAIVFSTGDRRTVTAIKLLEEFQIPAAIYTEKVDNKWAQMI